MRNNLFRLGRLLAHSDINTIVGYIKKALKYLKLYCYFLRLADANEYA
jgi:hypothetical protein